MIRRRVTDDERWAAAREMTRGRETRTAAAILVRRHVRFGLTLIVMGVVLTLVLTRTSALDVVFPPRATSREPYGWQLPLGITAGLTGAAALLWLRGANRLSNAGHALPLRDPRDLLTRRQKRDIDRRIRERTDAPSAWAPVAFDRALRFTTLPLPSLSYTALPLALASLTLTYRGPLVFLVLVWTIPIAVGVPTWWSERRFRAAAADWIATRGMVSAPVADPTPGS